MKIPADVDTARLPSLLALRNVHLTGYHAAHMGWVEPGKTVTMIGDPPRGRGRRRAGAG
ncbi:hypothetical protein FHS39_002408 [Streptomyces olivoverticillatus]|uniref:Uncharacterized protein n=1 Tax=Streptomyces olivoverticillatus TaxID=66427 RepID=A0A7W7LP11_9ACTN|nr:hypothetical protein [Streptomyces olivoverticillatus]MBB4893377.1 hypothetical protein [Streptomyces olivoverticillatus]